MQVNNPIPGVNGEKRKHLTNAIALSVAIPIYAHGQEALFFPVGQLLALATIFLMVLFLLRSVSWSRRIRIILIPMIVCIPFWFLPGNYFPDTLRYTLSGNLISGLVPPMLVGVLLVISAKGMSKHTPGK